MLKSKDMNEFFRIQMLSVSLIKELPAWPWEERPGPCQHRTVVGQDR